MSPGLPQDAVVRIIKKHVSNLWPNAQLSIRKWPRGPVEELGREFAVLEISPTRDSNNLWVYCTAGTGAVEGEAQQHEFVLLSSSSDKRHVETLTMVSHYHRFESPLDLGHIVTIGDTWAEGSSCNRLLMSLPYPFGPKLEWLRTSELVVRFLWALPITPEEAAFANQSGVEGLERRFDAAKLHYWDPLRPSVV
jgi:suppressor of fused protein SUFU